MWYDTAVKVFWTSLIISLIISLVCGVISVVWSYQLERDMDAVINRAQVAADAEDMHGYTLQLQANMERLGVTSGYTAVIFKRPDNNMALHYQAVKRINERLQQVVRLPKNDVAYQTALDDLRGVLRELPNPAGSVLWVRFGVFALWGCIILWLITAIAWFKAYGN